MKPKLLNSFSEPSKNYVILMDTESAEGTSDGYYADQGEGFDSLEEALAFIGEHDLNDNVRRLQVWDEKADKAVWERIIE